jgi:hypothetical protein
MSRPKSNTLLMTLLHCQPCQPKKLRRPEFLAQKVIRSFQASWRSSGDCFLLRTSSGSICRRWRRSSPSWSEHWRTEVRFPVGGCLASMTAPTTPKSEAQDPQGPGALHVVQRSEGASRQELFCQQIFPCLAQASVTHVPVKGTSVPLPVFRRCGISRGSTNQNWFRVYGGSA